MSYYMRIPADAECACCGSEDQLEIDHIVPQAKGGTDRHVNLQILCKRCNVSKGMDHSCHIEHGEIINNSEDLDGENDEHASNGVKRSGEREQADPLEAFSTRMHAKKKAVLLKQAKSRGIAAGLIIEELMENTVEHRILEHLARLEAKVDLVLKQTGKHEPPVHESPVTDYSWTRPGGWRPSPPPAPAPSMEVSKEPLPARRPIGIWSWLSRGG